MPEDMQSERFKYVYGPLASVSQGNGSILSNIDSPSVIEAVFASIRKKIPLPALSVSQPSYHREDQERLREAIAKTSQRIVERVYGSKDSLSPFLTAIIYHPYMNHPDEIRAALPKSPIERVVLYPFDNIPKFNLKKDLTIQSEARNRAIYGCLTRESELYLKEHIGVMEEVGGEYGLTLPEFIALEMIKPGFKILSPKKRELLEQKTDLGLLFLLLSGVDPASQLPKTEVKVA